ncbi:MAG: histidine kinase [Actinobacteria bacterium]|nr:histidine kinase [Actinomycetota bacterium]
MRSKGEAEFNDAPELLPEILTTTLLALQSDSLILLPGEVPIFQSAGISSFGVVRENRVVSEELLALVRVVRRTSQLHRGAIELPRGPIGEGKRELTVTVAPLNVSGMILVLISDESEYQKVDAIRRDFVANISHELKTPIGALLLLSEAVLGAKNDPEAVVKFASKMQKESRRLTDLVQEIINLSRLQGSDPLLSAYAVDVEDIIREAANQCQINAEGRNIEIVLGEISNSTVLGDRDQLIMAFQNLIENAINYSPERTKVSVNASVIEGVVEISVADQGIGISESELERIFERFYRIDPARSRETGGTGLGLSIVKHVAVNHGGDVKVWSKMNVGSTFALRLPIAPDESFEEGEN